ncbi:MAG TPA: class I SAM-dependent methyltransferase [Blastocatellia bacterium]|nr:class I SAM-dependent methyltransferase [Blastocatellia bacterium]
MSEKALRNEFNEWADAGRGERMARSHRPATEQAIEQLAIERDTHALDLGCGIGWAVRLMAARCPNGSATGVDISDRMIELARLSPDNPPNVRFDVGTAERLPYGDGAFNRVLSVESIYYYDDIEAALAEVAHVTAVGGAIALLVDYFEENVESHRWAADIAVPMQLLSAPAYEELLRKAGFDEVASTRLLDPSPLPDRASFTPVWGFDTWEQLERYKREGTLSVTGTRASAKK